MKNIKTALLFITLFAISAAFPKSSLIYKLKRLPGGINIGTSTAKDYTFIHTDNDGDLVAETVKIKHKIFNATFSERTAGHYNTLKLWLTTTTPKKMATYRLDRKRKIYIKLSNTAYLQTVHLKMASNTITEPIDYPGDAIGPVIPPHIKPKHRKILKGGVLTNETARLLPVPSGKEPEDDKPAGTPGTESTPVLANMPSESQENADDSWANTLGNTLGSLLPGLVEAVKANDTPEEVIDPTDTDSSSSAGGGSGGGSTGGGSAAAAADDAVDDNNKSASSPSSFTAPAGNNSGRANSNNSENMAQEDNGEVPSTLSSTISRIGTGSTSSTGPITNESSSANGSKNSTSTTGIAANQLGTSNLASSLGKTGSNPTGGGISEISDSSGQRKAMKTTRDNSNKKSLNKGGGLSLSQGRGSLNLSAGKNGGKGSLKIGRGRSRTNQGRRQINKRGTKDSNLSYNSSGRSKSTRKRRKSNSRSNRSNDLSKNSLDRGNRLADSSTTKRNRDGSLQELDFRKGTNQKARPDSNQLAKDETEVDFREIGEHHKKQKKYTNEKQEKTNSIPIGISIVILAISGLGIGFYIKKKK